MSAVSVLPNNRGEYSDLQVEVFRKEYPIGSRVVMYNNTNFTVAYEGTVVAVNKHGVQIEWVRPDSGKVFQTASKPTIDRFEVVPVGVEDLKSLTQLKSAA